MIRKSRRIISSTSTDSGWPQILFLEDGPGLGAGVGGEAGADGNRGPATLEGMFAGMPVLGVGGGRGCECCIDPFLPLSLCIDGD